MRALVRSLVFLLVCALVTSAAARSKRKRGKRARGPTILVGVLAEQADRKCTGKDKPQWVNRHYEVGFVPIVARERKLKRHAGKVVVVRGKVAREYQRKAVVNSGDCPPMQMRSDWVPGLHGMRVRRTKGVGFGAFKAGRIKRSKALKIKKRGGQLQVFLRNPVGKSLANMQVRVHYEGCYGKPARTVVTQRRAKFGRRAKMKASFPLFVAENVAKHGDVGFVPASVELRADHRAVAWDFDLSLASVGIDVKCPKKRR